MNADQLTIIAAAILSLLFGYVPGLKDWYEKLDTAPKKAAVMGIVLIVAAAGSFALSCANLVDIGVVCTKPGAVEFVLVVFQALAVNQGTYALFVKPYQLRA